MFPVICRVGGHPLISWTVLAIAGGWAAFWSLRSDFERVGIAARSIVLFFLGAALVWFGGAHLGQLATVGGSSGGGGWPREMFAGLVLYGGVLLTFVYGVAVWAFALSGRMLASELWDAGTLALAWAMFFGRLGCTLYGCCYGSPSGSWPGYALNFEHWDFETRSFPAGLRGVSLHPATLYEAAGWMVIILSLIWMRRKEKLRPGAFPPGVPAGIAWVIYALLRFALEFIRMDPRGDAPLGLSPSQWIALAWIPIGTLFIALDWKAKRVPLWKRSSRAPL